MSSREAGTAAGSFAPLSQGTLYIHGDDTVPGPLHPKLKALLAAWQARCCGRDMPRRDDLPPQTLRPWLSHLALLEPAGASFRFRISGTDLIPRCGGEATGKSVADLPAEFGASLSEILRRACATRAPVIAALIQRQDEGTALYSELVLPLQDRDPAQLLLLLGSYAIL
jgi:hypothetical protein